jgi:hypothetical protein
LFPEKLYPKVFVGCSNSSNQVNLDIMATSSRLKNLNVSIFLSRQAWSGITDIVNEKYTSALFEFLKSCIPIKKGPFFKKSSSLKAYGFSASGDGNELMLSPTEGSFYHFLLLTFSSLKLPFSLENSRVLLFRNLNMIYAISNQRKIF